MISLPDIYQLGPNAFRDSKSARDSVELLEEHGSLERVEGGAEVKGTWRNEVWRILGRS